MTEALIGLGVGVGIFLLTRTVLHHALVRRVEQRMERAVSEVPGGAAAWQEARADRTPAPRPPRNPTALTTLVRVPPSGGAPGEQFWAPGPAWWPSRGDPATTSRSDATIRLTATAAILVVCVGRVADRGAAHERPHRAAAEMPDAVRQIGPVVRVETGAGTAYRLTMDFGASRVTDWHLDHEGWGFVVGFLRKPQDEQLGAVMEHVFASWRWLPAEPGGAPVDGPVPA